MEKYIVDERTGWKYELVGDYYLPVGTRFEDADSGKAAAEAEAAKGSNPKRECPSIGRFGRAHG